ncbi:MAG: hypothetical protein KME17_09360 [Cyanosarcina radialis HA8281-LM2]|jgi:hypothetical protein|nr:hypothetical protein [Cyanosarcina radialis HA8281-LM2]
MTTQKVTVELPEAIFQQLARISQATHQPLEALAAQSIASNLPPTAENAPLEMQAELMEMQTLSIEELTGIARSQIEISQQQRHQLLLQKNQNDSITKSERQELSDLRLAADRLMVQKAYAWAILRWRGYRLPPLAELPL